MQVLDEEMETIHLYIVRGAVKRPYTAFPLFCAFLCLLGVAALTLYSGEHPYYEYKRLTVPATFLPLKVFRAEAPIIPTGVKTYPAKYAVGTLTITNGSVLSEVLPAGVIFSGANGVEVQTEEPTFIPAGSASGYGTTYASAKALTPGKSGNIPTLAVNAVYGTALYIRNMSPFTGGRDASSVTVQLPKDRQTAINLARGLVVSQKAQVPAFLANPCEEIVNNSAAIVNLIVNCQFVTFKVPSYMRVTAAKLSGKSFLVDVVFVPRPRPIWAK